MTDKELRKLSRAELLTLLVEVTEENERLAAILARRGVQEAGEGAAVPEGVTEDVQGVFQSLESTAVGFLKEAREISDRIILEAQDRADEMIADAKRKAAQITGGETSFADDAAQTTDTFTNTADGEIRVPGVDDLLLEEETTPQEQIDAVIEAQEEIRDPNFDTRELPWRESGTEAGTGQLQESEEAREPVKTEDADAWREAEEPAEMPEDTAQEAEPEPAEEAEPEDAVQEAEQAAEPEQAEEAEPDVAGEDAEEEEYVLPWLVKKEDTDEEFAAYEAVSGEASETEPGDSDVSGELREVTVNLPEEDATREADAPADNRPEETPADDVTKDVQPEAAPAEDTRKKPLTAIDMLRRMQQGGGQ